MEVRERVCGRTAGKRKERQTRWWNERTVNAEKEKNQAWWKWWKSKLDEDKDYMAKKRLSKKLIAEEKMMAWEEFTQRLEEDAERNKKMFYRFMRNKKGPAERTKRMESENGEIIVDHTVSKGCGKIILRNY